MPTYPRWCEDRCPRPQANPCCCLSIRKSVKFFHILNCILSGIGILLYLLWSFWYSRLYDATDDLTPKKCQDEILSKLDVIFSSIDSSIEENSIFRINSLLRLRGVTFVAGGLSCIFYITGSMFVIRTFSKKEIFNRSHAQVTFWSYALFNSMGIGCSFYILFIFHKATHSCILALYRVPIIILTAVFLGPYKIMEVAVTVQYIRCLAAFAFTRDIMGRRVSPDEPGWLVAWWRSRRGSTQNLELLKEAKERAQKQDEEYIKYYLQQEEEKYRTKYLNRIERSELAEKITYFERVGKYQKKIKGANTVADSYSSIFPQSQTTVISSNPSSVPIEASRDKYGSLASVLASEPDKTDLMSDTMTIIRSDTTIGADSIQWSSKQPSVLTTATTSIETVSHIDRKKRHKKIKF